MKDYLLKAGENLTMFIYTEKTFNKLLNEEIITEASNVDSTLIKDRIYPKISSVLSTPEGQRAFSNLVSSYVNKNSTKFNVI